MNAVIYARYSSDNQREESIEGQLRECLSYAEKNNLKIVNHYIDRAFSARTDDRPAFRQMIQESEKKEFSIILVWKLDRFSRDRYDSAYYKHQLKKNGVRVLSATENISEGPEGIILESMLEGMAEYYSAELAVKVRRGQQENALKCRSNGGVLPLGYCVSKDHTFEIVPEKAAIVREIFTRYDNGEALQTIANSLNKQGLRTQKGKEFRVSSLGKILRNRKYTGEYRYDTTVIPDGMPRIIEQDLFDRAQKEDLKLSITQAKLCRPVYSKDEILRWIMQFKYGSLSDPVYRRRIIDVFVNSVYIFDDKIVFTYNFKDGTDTFSLKDVTLAIHAKSSDVADSASP